MIARYLNTESLFNNEINNLKKNDIVIELFTGNYGKNEFENNLIDINDKIGEILIPKNTFWDEFGNFLNTKEIDYQLTALRDADNCSFIRINDLICITEPTFIRVVDSLDPNGILKKIYNINFVKDDVLNLKIYPMFN